jgi:hypothetical protein
MTDVQMIWEMTQSFRRLDNRFGGGQDRLVEISRLAGVLGTLAKKNKILEVGGAGQRLKPGQRPHAAGPPAGLLLVAM